MFDTLVNKAERESMMKHHLELTHKMNSHFKSKSMVGLIKASKGILSNSVMWIDNSEESSSARDGDTSMEGHDQPV